MVRALAIDLGTRRIGVAVSDGLGWTAQPLATINRHGGKRDLEAIAQWVRKYEVGTLVLGLPTNPEGEDGEKGRMVRMARNFAETLRTHFSLPVEMVDESFTSVQAESLLIDANLSRTRRREVVDKVAAALILQRWLDAQKGDLAGQSGDAC